MEITMRKLVLVLIALIAAVTFIRSLDTSLKAAEPLADTETSGIGLQLNE
ncbi:MAG: hypothetical protein LBP37_05000 [Spirochaetaceae bacterium]|nr:hypothetical protein [Spirochaetaceae bacterium]